MMLRNQTIILFIYYIKNENNSYFVNFLYFKTIWKVIKGRGDNN